jgi:hypothetical protein
MNRVEEVIALTDQLSLAEKVQLLEHLSTALRHDIALEAYRHMEWNQFLDLTYGSLAHDPIERHQPLEADKRDEIE